MQRSRINANKYLTIFVRKYQCPDSQDWKSYGGNMHLVKSDVAVAKRILEGEHYDCTLVRYLDRDDPIDPWRAVIATTPVDEIVL
jgi:hypothetical protein